VFVLDVAVVAFEAEADACDVDARDVADVDRVVPWDEPSEYCELRRP
jgi:hypothetical protein